jgi:hypothetical protein
VLLSPDNHNQGGAFTMPYAVVRLYTGSGDAERAFETIMRDAVPVLSQAGGLRRYTTAKMQDGRIATISVYDDKASAERGLEVAAKWVRENSTVMQGFALLKVYKGDIVYLYQSDPNVSIDGSTGVMRVYQSPASPDDLKAAMQQEAEPILRREAVQRYFCFKREDTQGYVVCSTHDKGDAATRLTQLARETRNKSGSLLQKTLPNDPDEVAIATVYKSVAF